MDGMNVYFDYQATTPMDPRVLEEMMLTMTKEFGNASSKSHAFGWEAEKYVEKARQQVADLIGAGTGDIVFTSGATESNNMAIKGVARANHNSETKNHLVTLRTEHKCVLETCNYLRSKENFDVTFLGVGKDGLVDLEELESSLTTRTILVSIMGVNNEIGVVQPLEKIGALCHRHGVYFHSDCAQAFGKIPLDVTRMGIDLMSISGHKIYGPKGVGAIYARQKPRVKIEALIHGGGQENGLRSGTLPVPLIVGLGKAAEIAGLEMEKDRIKIEKLADKIMDSLLTIDKVYLNGSRGQRWPGCLNFSFAGIEGESLIMALKNLAVSSGSACTSSTLEPSYVIQALGVDSEMAHSSLRIGLGKFSTEEEVNYLIEKIKTEVPRLREMSPVWEMMKKGIPFDYSK
ncbi:MAG: IscS subfamily cysteine desulfurase [Rickettsiales bacterium]|jgi:cysteine desulfurase|nr:IscS subfamily cysteine desulfurase [Rickettsiales bacterium]